MGFLIPTGATPEQLALIRALGQRQAQNAAQPREIKSWTQGAAQLAEALFGGLKERAAFNAENEGRATADAGSSKLLETLFGRQGGGAGVSATADTGATAPGTTNQFTSDMLRTGPKAVADGTAYKGPAYLPPASEREAFIRAEAEKRNLNPDAVVKGAQGEGLADGVWQSRLKMKDGTQEPSFGDFQLFTGGGMGNDYQKTTGKDPRDANNWQDMDRFALDHMAKTGDVSPWYGFARQKVTNADIRGPGKPVQVASADPNFVPNMQPPAPPSMAAKPPEMAQAPLNILPPGQFQKPPVQQQPPAALPAGNPIGFNPITPEELGPIMEVLRNPYTRPEDRAMILKVLESRLPKTEPFVLKEGETPYNPNTMQPLPGFKAGGNKAPTVRDGYDAEGRKIKEQWNQATGAWEQVGGAYKKAPYMTPTQQKAILEADDAVRAGLQGNQLLTQALELNKKVGAVGLLGETGNKLGSWWEGDEGGENTDALNLRKLVTQQALEQLKTTFGGNPTEGERAILIEIQGAPDQPPLVRKSIFERAQLLVNNRLKFNREKAKALREGTYFVDGGDPNAPQDEDTLEDLEAEAARRAGGQ